MKWTGEEKLVIAIDCGTTQSESFISLASYIETNWRAKAGVAYAHFLPEGKCSSGHLLRRPCPARQHLSQRQSESANGLVKAIKEETPKYQRSYGQTRNLLILCHSTDLLLPQV